MYAALATHKVPDFDTWKKAFDAGSSARQAAGIRAHCLNQAHDDPNVRYEALLAVQKLMVHNWEYLGKQLEKEQGEKGRQMPIKAS